MKRYAYILLFLILVLGLPAPAVFAETAYFSVIPFYAPEKIWNLYNPFAEHLTRTTGTKWALKGVGSTPVGQRRCEPRRTAATMCHGGTETPSRLDRTP